MKVGTVVKLAKSADDMEASSRFIVIEDNGDRLIIRLICNLPIPPSETVRINDVIADE